MGTSRTISLRPTRHDSPRCDSYEDESAIRRFEREVRVHRAHTESFTIRLDDGRADGTFFVGGEAGRNYAVDIVDATGDNDACDCPDFVGNAIGTCKHLEAVRRAIAASPRLRRGFKSLGAGPRVPTLTVRFSGDLALQFVARGSRPGSSALARWGLCMDSRGRVEPVDETVPLPGRHEDLRVVHAVPHALARIRARSIIMHRREELRAAYRRGQIGLDVLTQPLFPYQRDGVIHLMAGGRALLADDMGLGKTVQAIAAAEALRARGEARRVVIVTPASLKQQWAREVERYTRECAVIIGGGIANRAAAFASDAPYKILNYELTWKELDRLRDLAADILILDEAQRAKNFRTKTADTLRLLPSRFLFVLTGTPVENRLDDLYSLLQLVQPDILGPLWKFNLDFHQQNAKGKIVGCKNLSELRLRIAPVVLRRRKEEVLLDLPPLTEQTRYTALSPEQKRIEAGYRTDAAVLLSISERRALTPDEQKKLMALLLKARQACNALELCDPSRKRKASPKLDEFEALIGEIAGQGSSKVLVFSEWVEMLKLAAGRLDALQIGHLTLHGGVPVERRGELLDRFRSDPNMTVLLSSDAGGVGLNLQVASYVVHLDLPWNPARLDQRTSRAHRLGQTRGVSVTYLCSEEGIERGIEGTLAGKRAVRSAALDADSKVEELELQSFSVFLRQMREVMQAAAPTETLERTSSDAPLPAAVDEVHIGQQVQVAAAGGTLEQTPISRESTVAAIREIYGETPNATAVTPSTNAVVEKEQIPAAPDSGTICPVDRSQNRLRLAKVVLEAGFAGDAVHAAYEALASAIAGLLDQPPPQGHAALVGAIYRDLTPSGRLPMAAHFALARLHDLTSLESQGVAVTPSLASEAVAEAESWVVRIGQR